MDATGTELKVCEDLIRHRAFAVNNIPLTAKICADITARQQLGIKKYGQTVANNPLPLKQWLQHAYEEALDLAIYLRRASDEIGSPSGTVARIALKLSTERHYKQAINTIVALRLSISELK